jgi:type I restriction enzyme S subunit
MSWQEVKLFEITDFIKRGISPKYVEDGGFSIINQKCIRGNTVSMEFSRLCSSDKKIPDEKYIRVGDVLVNSTGAGTLGRTGWIKELNEPTTVDTHVTIVRPKKYVVSDKFLALYLSLKENEIESMGKGATNQTELSASILGTLKINLPPLETQKRIASILSNYDDLIENNLKRIKLLEETAQNIYKEWFVNFRFPDYEHTEFDEESDLPVGWELKKVEECIKVMKGKKPKKEYSTIGENRILYLLVDVLERRELRFTENESVQLTSEGETLMLMDGSRSGLVFKSLEGALGSTLAVFRIKNAVFGINSIR